MIHAFISSSGLAFKLHNLPHAWSNVHFPKQATEEWEYHQVLCSVDIESQNHGAIKAGKDLKDHLVQASMYHQYCPLNRVPCSNYSSPKQPWGARAFPKALWWTLPLGPHNLRAITVKEWGKRREHHDGRTQRSAQLIKRIFRRGFQVQGQQGCTMGTTAPGMGALKDSGGRWEKLKDVIRQRDLLFKVAWKLPAMLVAWDPLSYR